MVKSAPSPARIAVMAAFALSCFGLLLFLWIAFGGPVPLAPKGYRVTASFSEAGQLAAQADVRIAGVPVGRVTSIEPDVETGRSLVVLELDAEHAPLPADAGAILRQKTLLGETYVELTPGTDAAPPVPEGGRLADGRIGETVELDEVLRALDPETRVAFQDWMQTQAEALDGHGRDLNDALGHLAPLAEDAGRLVRRAPPPGRRAAPRRRRHRRGVRGADGARRPAARADREHRRRCSGPRRRATARWPPRWWRCRPSRPSRERTVRRLTRFLRDTDPLVRQLRPAARELGPALRDLTAVAPDLRGFLEALGPLITASERGFPAAERTLQRRAPAARPARSRSGASSTRCSTSSRPTGGS